MIYNWVCISCGDKISETQSIQDGPSEKLTCPGCGGRAERDAADFTGRQSCWPEYASDALGVHPDQIPEMKKLYPHHRFNREGQMLIGSHSEFKRVLKDLNMVDRNRETHGNARRR